MSGANSTVTPETRDSSRHQRIFRSNRDDAFKTRLSMRPRVVIRHEEQENLYNHVIQTFLEQLQDGGGASGNASPLFFTDLKS